MAFSSWEGTLDPGDYELSARTVGAAGHVLNEAAAGALRVPEPAVEIARSTMEPPSEVTP